MRGARFVMALPTVLVMASAAWAVPSGGSGLYGIVLAGPTQPVCRIDEPCEKPVRVTLVFTRLGTATEVGRTRSTTAGRYRIELPAGRYSVRTVERIGIDRTMKPRRVHVRADRFDRIVFRIDTGIRK